MPGKDPNSARNKQVAGELSAAALVSSSQSTGNFVVNGLAPSVAPQYVNVNNMAAPVQFFNTNQIIKPAQPIMNSHPLLYNAVSSGQFSSMYCTPTIPNPTNVYAPKAGPSLLNFPPLLASHNIPNISMPMMDNEFQLPGRNVPMQLPIASSSSVPVARLPEASQNTLVNLMPDLGTVPEASRLLIQMPPALSLSMGVASNSKARKVQVEASTRANSNVDFQRTALLLEAVSRRKAVDEGRDRDRDSGAGPSSIPSSAENSVRGGTVCLSAGEGSPAEGDMGEDDDDDLDEDIEEMDGVSTDGRQKGLRRKNRLAQRRFRERQRNALNSLLVKTEDQELSIVSLRKEKKQVEELNRTLLERLHQLQNLMS